MATLTQLFGKGFDEASFALATGLMRFQRPTQFNTDRSRLEQIRALAELGPSQLFPTPPGPTVSEKEEPRPWQLNPLGQKYQLRHLTYPSAYPLGQPNNDTVHAYYLYRPGYETAPTLVYLHGWMAYSPGLWLRPPMSLAEPLGLNILFVEQPFHMHRCPPGMASGQLSMSGDLLMGLAGVQQAVSDVRAGLRWLQSQGVAEVALLGRSLGGLVAATALTIEPGFSCGVLDIPAVSPHSSIWRSNYTRLVRADLRRQGLDEQETAAAFEALRPGRFRPVIDPARILLIMATEDRACFPEDTERFAQEWGIPPVRIPLGHMSIMLSRHAKRTAQQFLAHWLLQASSSN